MQLLSRPISLLLTTTFLLAQLGGCDRRPVTAEQPGAAKMAGSNGGAAVTTTEKMHSDKSSKN